MRYLLQITGLILLIVSNFGYFCLWEKKLKMNICYRPVFTVAIQMVTLFFGGLFNVLRETALLLFVAGLFLLAYYLYREGIRSLKQYLNVGYLYFFVMLLLVAIAVKGAVFVRYDNFSHWALIVKEMLRTDRYPNFESTLIEFTSYPPGSATYLYYVGKIAGKSESLQMFVQAYMMLTCLLPLYAYMGKRKRVGTVYMVILTNFLLVFEIRIQDLLVDTLLPLFGMATVLYAYYECYEKQQDRDDEKKLNLLALVPMLASVYLIKNSGMFFIAAVHIIVLLIFVKDRKTAASVACVIAAPFIVLHLWNQHCKYVFVSAATSKHAMTVENYRNMLGSKASEEMQQIVQSVLRFSVTGKDLVLFGGFLITIGILTLLFQRKWFGRYVKYAGISVGAYVFYMIGMLCMYLFSMPGNEAATLAGSERYRRTIIIALIVFLSVYIFRLLEALEEENRKHYVAGFVMIAILALVWRIALDGFVTVFDRAGSPKKRNWMDQVIAEYDIQPGRSYVICVKKDDAGYFYYLTKYLLSSDAVSVRIISDQSQTEDFDQYEYIMNYSSKSKALRKWIRSNVPEQADNEVVVLAR